MIKINEAKEIREQLNLTHVVIFGVDKEGKQHVATHGKSKGQAIEAATLGNSLKNELNWPKQLCKSTPQERICKLCDYFKRGYHRPGDVIEDNKKGLCMYSPEPIPRYEKDIACHNFLY
jgi:hypothetical protein